VLFSFAPGAGEPEFFAALAGGQILAGAMAIFDGYFYTGYFSIYSMYW